MYHIKFESQPPQDGVVRMLMLAAVMVMVVSSMLALRVCRLMDQS